jgi:hypothetical protein
MEAFILKKIFKIAVLMGLIVLSAYMTRLGFSKLADQYVIYHIFTPDQLSNLSKLGVEHWRPKKICSDILFSVFPSMLCPAVKNYINDEKNNVELRAGVFSVLPDFPQKHRSCAEEILVDNLKRDGWDVLAALELGYFGKDAISPLTEAWKNGGSLGLKSSIAQSMIRIDDKSFIPVLTESLKRDKSFKPVLSKADKTETVEAVFSLIALYEITNDDKYKAYITRIFKNGAVVSRLSAIAFMDGFPAKENMIPFLRMGLNDKNKTARELSKKNIDMIEKNLKDQGVVDTSSL